MRTLVYKDLLAMIRSKAVVPSLLCMAAGLVAMHSGSPVGLFLLFMPTYYFAAYSGMYDFKYAQERFFLSLPVSRNSWVLSRYLSCLLVAFASLALAVAAGSAGSLLRLPVRAPGALDSSLVVLTACLTCGLSLPFQFRLGYEKTRWINFVVMIANSSAVSIVRELSRSERGIVTIGISEWAAAACIAAAGTALAAVSYAVSCAFFSRREF